jgi:formylglycine-generating enzyme required for sulfatase activity/ABC-type dipeptide/oligopeptide/nickel transport system ATPase subunit
LWRTKNEIKNHINVKFKAYRKFSDYLNSALYESKDDYFWVKNFEDNNVSFLGLNSAWASESKKDRHNITLGYPQVMGAFKKSNCSTRILLMHHPLFEWFSEEDFVRYREEILSRCGLILHGHAHFDTAWLVGTPSSSCINLGANASYTDDKKGFIGFQFIKVESREDGLSVRVWPYICDLRAGIRFHPDRDRYDGQQGKEYFDLDTSPISTKKRGEIVQPLTIPQGYKNWIKEFHSTMSIEELARRGEVITVSLPEVYIPLETANPSYKIEEFKKEHETKESATIDIEELLGQLDYILLRGQAGMGKTTLIKHLAYTITQGFGPVSLRGYLPVIVFLKDLWLIFNEALESSRKMMTLEPLLKTYLERSKCQLPWEIVSNYLSRGKALFLFDGLDEVPETIRPELVDIIANFRFENENNRFLITGRPHGVAGKAIERFEKHLFDIEHIDNNKIEDFIPKWFRAVSGQATGLADLTAHDMIADIRQHEHVAVFTQNPLLLTAVCILYSVGKRIPEQRSDLYDRIVANLMYRRFHDPAEPDKSIVVLEYLMRLAFEMHKKNLKTFEVDDAIDVLKECIPKKDDEPLSDYKRRIDIRFNEIEPNCGLLNRLRGGEIEFTHLTFQEFMAAKHLIYTELDYAEFIEKEWWEETILLYTGIKNLTTKEGSNKLVKQILNTSQKEEKSQRRLWLLGSKALRDFQPIKRKGEIVALACEKLYKVIESDASLEERFEAGEIVGALSDLRIEADNMVLVKAGKFMRGSSEDDAYLEEKPQREIYLDGFMIGKYPVTNKEFKEFIDDYGYDGEEFWSKEGWQWREENEISEPEYWHDRKWNAPNFPVVGISWFEAEAYANWLSERKGYRYRLPTEAEWEKAARGSDDFKYPWGEDFDEYLCNSDESGLYRASPVGIFPKGKSPYGCFDMAGNVGEWCSDWYNGNYYANSPDKNPKGPFCGAGRVIRGGSWFNPARYCRSAFRAHYDPRGRDNGLGFRILQEQ